MQASSQKLLVVNADDFGLSAGVNAGILHAHCAGIVTSASLMVRWPAASEAVAMAGDCPALSLGLHVDLGEWIYQQGEWRQAYCVVDLESAHRVAREIQAQLDRFVALVGISPTHLDSHQHVHRHEPVKSVLNELGAQLHIPVRHFSPSVSYCGAFYGQTPLGEPLEGAIEPESLIGLLAHLPTGATELCCHPGWDGDLATMYCSERRKEVATLCDATVQAALTKQHIKLISFRELSAAISNWPIAASAPEALIQEAVA